MPTFHPNRRAITSTQGTCRAGPRHILVACAGTSDLPVAEEAAISAEVMGKRVDRLYDVGVAGIHRLLAERSGSSAARVIIVVAGMEGALPSVVGGLVSVPVIAVPTSVGYGASFGGIAALLAMLNSCASGVSVVNIDNGFGAACMASRDQPPVDYKAQALAAGSASGSGLRTVRCLAWYASRRSQLRRR